MLSSYRRIFKYDMYMSIPITEFRRNLFRLVDQALKGEPIEFIHNIDTQLVIWLCEGAAAIESQQVEISPMVLVELESWRCSISSSH